MQLTSTDIRGCHYARSVASSSVLSATADVKSVVDVVAIDNVAPVTAEGRGRGESQERPSRPSSVSKMSPVSLGSMLILPSGSLKGFSSHCVGTDLLTFTCVPCQFTVTLFLLWSLLLFDGRRR